MRKVSSGHLLSIDILWCPQILLADSEGPDKTATMHMPQDSFSHGVAHLQKKDNITEY